MGAALKKSIPSILMELTCVFAREQQSRVTNKRLFKYETGSQ